MRMIAGWFAARVPARLTASGRGYFPRPAYSTIGPPRLLIPFLQGQALIWMNAYCKTSGR